MNQEGKVTMKTFRSVLVAVGLVASSFVVGGSVLVSVTTASATSFKPCTASQIKVTRGASQGTAGTSYTAIVFTNTGAACSIVGVPAVQPVVGATRRAQGPSARNGAPNQTPGVIVITKGHAASDAFGVVDTGAITPSNCVARKASGVLVTLGSYVHATYLRLAITVCTKQASTTTRAVVAGVTGV
jgi:hypothetical protein